MLHFPLHPDKRRKQAIAGQSVVSLKRPPNHVHEGTKPDEVVPEVLKHLLRTEADPLDLGNLPLVHPGFGQDIPQLLGIQVTFTNFNAEGTIKANVVTLTMGSLLGQPFDAGDDRLVLWDFAVHNRDTVHCANHGRQFPGFP
jgi:hypothetical protein